MLNEMLQGRYYCPVCGRIIYFPIRGYWCPYCGLELNNREDLEKVEESTERITARDELGRPYYRGRHTFRSKAYAQDLSISAIAEILEKLAQYEESMT